MTTDHSGAGLGNTPTGRTTGSTIFDIPTKRLRFHIIWWQWRPSPARKKKFSYIADRLLLAVKNVKKLQTNLKTNLKRKEEKCKFIEVPGVGCCKTQVLAVLVDTRKHRLTCQAWNTIQIFNSCDYNLRLKIDFFVRNMSWTHIFEPVWPWRHHKYEFRRFQDSDVLQGILASSSSWGPWTLGCTHGTKFIVWPK